MALAGAEAAVIESVVVVVFDVVCFFLRLIYQAGRGAFLISSKAAMVAGASASG